MPHPHGSIRFSNRSSRPRTRSLYLNRATRQVQFSRLAIPIAIARN